MSSIFSNLRGTYQNIFRIGDKSNPVQFRSNAGIGEYQNNGGNWEPFASNNLRSITGSTYKTIQDWADNTQGTGRFSGGTVTDNGDGTVAVAALTGFIRSGATDIDDLYFFDHAGSASVALTNNDTNYICVNYNGGAPTITATIDPSTVNFNSTFCLAKVFRDGTTLSILDNGAMTGNLVQKIYRRFCEHDHVARVSGLILSETGTRNIAVTSGVMYAGLNRFEVSAQDTSGADTFTYWYRDGGGGWTQQLAQTQISNTFYDDNSGVLATLANNRFGVHWVYMDHDGDLHVVYGQGSYTSVEATEAQPPAVTPDIVGEFSTLVGKIIILKNAAVFTTIESAFAFPFQGATALNHNDLAGLNGGAAGEYYHLTATQHYELTGGDITLLHDHSSLTDGTGTVTFDGSNRVTINGDYSFPAADGTSTQILQTDGAGVLSWVDKPDGYFELDIVPTPNVVRQPSGYNQDFVFGSTQLDYTFDVLHNSRFLFDESKSAFRAGYANGTQWDDGNRGNFSAAFGENCRASGSHSFASGSGAIASNTYSFAHGISCNVSGVGTAAFGSGGTHAGNYSGSFGSGHTMSGNTSFASGSSNNVSGSDSAALGSGIAISENYAFGCGQGHTIDKRYATAMGVNARTYWYASNVFASGNLTSDGDRQAGKIHIYGAGGGGYIYPGDNGANTMQLQTNRIYGLKLRAIAFCTGAGGGVSVGDFCDFEITASARNLAGVCTIVNPVSTTITQYPSMATTNVQFQIVGTELRINTTNTAGCTMYWSAYMEFVEGAL